MSMYYGAYIPSLEADIEFLDVILECPRSKHIPRLEVPARKGNTDDEIVIQTACRRITCSR